ncbi:MAG: glycosyltransferase [Blastocatellia bacterium]|nr:glycosyltransferase [Blastocatellia bacterium]
MSSVKTGKPIGAEEDLPSGRKKENSPEENSSSSSIKKLIYSETSRQTTLLFAAQISSTLLNAAASAVMANWLGRDKFGIFVFCSISIIQFLSYFFEFGIASAGARLLAIERGTEGERKILGGLITAGLSIGLLFSLMIALLAEFIDQLFNTEVKDILLMSAPLCVGIPMQFFLEQACQGLNRIKTLALQRLILPAASFSFIAATLLLGADSPKNVLLASLTGTTLSTFVVVAALKPSFANLTLSVRQIIDETRRFGLDIYLGRVTSMASTKLDSVLIPIFLGTTAFGFYAVAQKFSEPLINLSRSMSITRFKSFANDLSVKRIVAQSNFLLLIVGTLGLIVLGPYLIVLIYSKDFAPAGELMLPFAIGSCLLGLIQPYNGFLSAHGRGGELRNISFAIGLINVFSLFLVIPRFAMMGAAWMLAFGATLNFSLHYYYYRKFCKEQVSNRLLQVTLVDLSNDSHAAVDWIKRKYGDVKIEKVDKNDIKTGSKLTWLKKLRQNERDIFLIFCDRFEWQTRQTPMMLFGLLTGAEECWLVDCHDRGIRRSRFGIIAIEIPHFLVEIVGSGLVILLSWLFTLLLELKVCYFPAKPKKWQGQGEPKIVFIRTTPTSGAQTGGSNSHIVGFSTGAVAEGASLQFVSNDAISGIKPIPIEVIHPSPFFNSNRMVFELWNNLTFTFRSIKLIKKASPDFIYHRYSRFSWAGVAASCLTGIPLILEFNGSEVWIGRYWDSVNLLWLLEKFEKLNLIGSHIVFVVSEVVKQNLVKDGYPAEKIEVNPNGVDPEVFKPGRGGNEIREKLGIKDKTLIGFVGTFGPWHGVPVLADAITEIPEDANCHFLLIGDGNLKPAVEKQIQDAGCSSRATFTGKLSHKSVPSHLDACDILVAPTVKMEDGSEFFGSPTKLFEYMAMGKAIVASGLGQVGDVIKDGKNGCLVEAGNSKQLAKIIMELAANPEERTRLGKQAREDAIASYTWRKNAARVIKAFKQLDIN